MIFSELYSAYYNAVAGILKTAIDHPLKKNELRGIIEETAFGESVLTIEPALMQGRWQLLAPDGTTILEQEPKMPLTLMQKRWLKAICLDPRIRLFTDDLPEYPDVDPLFTPDDYMVFDRYTDGDDYEDEGYRQNFRTIYRALQSHTPIRVSVESRSGQTIKRVLLPQYLEYSEKDDKFRLIASGRPTVGTINLGRIRSCELFTGEYREEEFKEPALEKRSVVFELYDKRNALERVLLHFAHFEKEAENLGEGRYRVTLRYDKDDETEMVIRILSFGPMVRVLGPDSFCKLIKQRLLKQQSCGL